MTKKQREERSRRLRELAAMDRKNRCPWCKAPLGKVTWKEALDDRQFCSRECMEDATKVNE